MIKKGLVLKISLMERSEVAEGIESMAIIDAQQVKDWVNRINNLSNLGLHSIKRTSSEDLGEVGKDGYGRRDTIVTSYFHDRIDDIVDRFVNLSEKDMEP